MNSADLDEDINVFVKDLVYSHYYHPEKQLQMRRYDSMVRVSRLEIQLNIEPVPSVDDLGHLIHHLQDMAAPPHVVPVNHWFTDGFENHAPVTSGFASGYSCQDLQKFHSEATDLRTVLHDTAETTIQKVRKVSLPAQFTGASGDPIGLRVPLTWFWQESSDNSFGQYGVLGNNFGQPTMAYGKGTITIPMTEMLEFKRQQLQLAVQATLQALAVKLAP
jgi:hypothetical protein